MTAQRRRLVLLLALAAGVVIVGLAITAYSDAPRLVTWAALRRAQELALEVARQPLPPPGELFEFRLFQAAPQFEKSLEEAYKLLAVEYGSLFRAGYFDPGYVLEQAPREGFTPQALPLAVLCGAYALVFEDDLRDSPEVGIHEAIRWARAVCRSARAKECLVSLLTRNLEIAPGHFEPGGLPKMGLIAALTCRQIDDYGWGKDRSSELDEILRRVLDGITANDWRPVLEHSRHEREGVRAGALLLLCHHPERETFVARAKEALQDPSRLVRLAAAVALAYHRDATGAEQLVDGLEHERWEVRWWSARCLAYFAEPGHLPRVQKLGANDPDPFVKKEVSQMERVWQNAATR